MEKSIKSMESRILLTSDTKYINIDDMQKITLDDLPFCMPLVSLGRSGDWYVNDNCVAYYLKRRGYLAIILNELIGEYLSKYMGLETVEYDLAYEDDNIVGLFSKNFRKPKVDYVYYQDLTEDEKIFINNVISGMAKTHKARKYKKQYTDYLMRNFYANQGDKVFNVLCCRKARQVYLSTLFDYEESFLHACDTSIFDPFLTREELSYELINKLRRKDKCFDKSLEKVLGFNMEDTLGRIKVDFGINVPDVVLEHYISYDRERKRLMKEKICIKNRKY